tara:strand:- start:527 stop:715 length:189 start_codon:yes stop_codon:yes gene_type:complete
VTAFITRDDGPPAAHELLVFEYPHAVIQLPAGTVDSGEAFEAKAVEATRLAGLTLTGESVIP